MERHTSVAQAADEAPWPARISRERLKALTEHVTLAGTERTFVSVHTPFTGDQIGEVPAGQPEDIQKAVEQARPAQRAWARRSMSHRRKVLLRCHDLVLERQHELLDVMQLEGGKARRHAFEEVLDVAINSRYYAYHGEEHLRSRRREGALPLLTTAREHHHPVGVVGLIAPWNYPLTLAVSDALPALMAGNAVVLKPALQTPFTALLAKEVMQEAGLPPDLFQIVTGRGRELGPPLIGAVDFVGFTGSTETGRKVAALAGEHLTKCSLELGGKNPMLVLDDADLERAVEGAVQGCFANAGQLCISFERLYVQGGIYDRFVDRFVERTRALRLSASYTFAAEVGSLISQEQLDAVAAHVQDAVDHGAEVLTGGRARPDIGPYFYEPTVLRSGSPNMRAAQEETFGPVVVVHRFGDVEEAIQAANDSPYGLNASLWTGRTRQARQWARRIQCGTVNINEAYAAAWGSVDAPMGGMKASGLGRRHGREGILKYTESQTVAEQRLFPVVGFPDVLHPRTYARLMSQAVGVMRYLPGMR